MMATSLGTTDEFRIYDQSLTAEQVRASYLAGPDAPVNLLYNDLSTTGALGGLVITGANEVTAPPGGPFVTTSHLGADVRVYADGTFEYDPTNAPEIIALGDQYALDYVDYTADDGIGSSRARVSISITGTAGPRRWTTRPQPPLTRPFPR